MNSSAGAYGSRRTSFADRPHDNHGRTHREKRGGATKSHRRQQASVCEPRRYPEARFRSVDARVQANSQALELDWKARWIGAGSQRLTPAAKLWPHVGDIGCPRDVHEPVYANPSKTIPPEQTMADQTDPRRQEPQAKPIITAQQNGETPWGGDRSSQLTFTQSREPSSISSSPLGFRVANAGGPIPFVLLTEKLLALTVATFDEELISASRCLLKIEVTRHRHVETSTMSGSALTPCVAGSVRHRAKTARLSMVVTLLIAIDGSSMARKVKFKAGKAVGIAAARLWKAESVGNPWDRRRSSSGSKT